MKKKYEFTGETTMFRGRVLHRIRALRDFGEVKKGDLGGWIEKQKNLSHKGNCWVYDEAIVCDRAEVSGNAKVYDNAEVYDKALVYGNAQVFGNAQVYDIAKIYDNAQVYCDAWIHDGATICGDAQVFGKARVYDNAMIFDKAEVYGSSYIFGNAKVFGNARVYGDACIYGNAEIHGNARVYGEAWVQYSELTKDIREDLIQYIACSLGIYPAQGKYVLYKKVYKIAKGKYTSLSDPDIIYKDGKTTEVRDYDPNFETSCSAGIHCSTPFYWKKGDTLIAVEVKVEDVITCMAGKVRAKKVKVLEEVGR